VSLHYRIEPACKAGSNHQPRPVGVDQGVGGFCGVLGSRPGLDEHNLTVAATTCAHRKAVAAEHADIAQQIDKTSCFLRKCKDDPEISLWETQDICHMAILTMSPKWRFAANTADGSKPQCIRQSAQRGSLPGPYFDQSVAETSSA